MSGQRTYLDFNASHPLRAEARAAMIEAMSCTGNPSSVHAEGRHARAIIETARREVAALFDVDAADVVFTSGATEANNWVVMAGWDQILLSALEHDSVRKPATSSAADVVWLPVTNAGVLDVAATVARLEERRIIGRRLLCLTAANNETGVIQPVSAVAERARASGVMTFVDAVQVAGRLGPEHVSQVDFISVSAHKIGGPKGVGALILRDGGDLAAFIKGGGQERGRRSGTENLAGIAGFGAAARVARGEVAAFDAVGARRERLLAGMRAVTPDLEVVGASAPRLANTLCVALPGLSADAVVIQMDLAGVAISAGAACSSGKVGSSAVLDAMAVPAELRRAAVRFSIGTATTTNELDAAVEAWRGIVSRRRAAA